MTIPDAVDVLPGLLWIGGAGSTANGWPEGISLFVKVWGAGTSIPRCPTGCEVIHEPYGDLHVNAPPRFDHPDNERGGPTEEQLDRLSNLIVKTIDQHKAVLVQCYGGLNRSGILVARTLMRIGYPAQQAINKVRIARGTTAFGHALNNLAFVSWLEYYEFEHKLTPGLVR